MDLVEQEYQMVPVSLIRPHPFNPNEGDEKSLEESVNQNGFYGAVILRPHPDEPGAFQLLGGEHRWKLACRRGTEDLPAIVLQDIDDVKAVRILLADNEVARRGHYNQDALDKALEYIGDIRGTGFDAVLDAVEAEIDADEDAAVVDDETPEREFEREYGILVLAESELEQASLFEDMCKIYGASKLRVVSV